MKSGRRSAYSNESLDVHSRPLPLPEEHVDGSVKILMILCHCEYTNREARTVQVTPTSQTL
jgi:hypothetical protein